MPFILPFLPAIIAGVAGTAGAIQGSKVAGSQTKALNIQDQIAQQEQADKQKAYDQLMQFFNQYLGKGSPFLAQQQRASAEQNAQQFNNAAGTLRNQVQASGLGYGPSATTAAGIGGLGTQAAATSSSDYLTNLLNNENLKFQAAQGIQGAGAMAGNTQNQPNVSTQIPYTSPNSNIFGLSQVLQGLLKGQGGTGGSTNAPIGNLPLPTVGVGGTPPFLPGPTPTAGSSDNYFG